MWSLRFQYKYIHGNLIYLLLILDAGYSGKTGVVQNKSAEQEGDRQADFQSCCYNSLQIWNVIISEKFWILFPSLRFYFQHFFFFQTSWRALHETCWGKSRGKILARKPEANWPNQGGHHTGTELEQSPCFSLPSSLRERGAVQRHLQAQRRQVFLNNNSYLKPKCAAHGVWQASPAGDLVSQVTGGRLLTLPISNQVNMTEMRIPPWRLAGLFWQRQMRVVRRGGSSHICETEKGDVGCAAGSTNCQVEWKRSLTPADSLARAAAGAARGAGREWKTNWADMNAGSGKAVQEHELFPFTFW